MDSKRFYWIKLKTDFFEDDKIDFIMSQKNGSEYIVLYQLLCLKTANNNGCLGVKIGDMLLKWDEEKIQRECKYFDIDTVRVALSLYKNLGLVYEGNDELIRIANFEEMVGSETNGAKRIREWREKKLLQCNIDVTQEKEIEKEIEKDKDIECNKEIYIDEETHPIINEPTDNLTNVCEKKREKVPQKEKKKKNVSTADLLEVARVELSSLEEYLFVVEQFILMRNRINKPLTEYAMKLICYKVKRLSSDINVQMQIFQQSIVKSWQDIYEIKEDCKNAKPSVKVEEKPKEKKWYDI